MRDTVARKNLIIDKKEIAHEEWLDYDFLNQIDLKKIPWIQKL